MEYNKRTDESGQPLTVLGDATIGRNGVILESLLANGVYNASCLRVKPDKMAAFLPLWNRRNAAERTLHRRFARFVPRMRRILLEEIEDLTEHMRRFQYTAWEAVGPNVVATVGKNLALDTFLAGSSYTVTGPYLGLISSVSYSAVAAGDTMASHSGWLEAGNANAPTYTAPRKTAAWSGASSGSKALSAALTYAITGTGTVKGAFMLYGSGAVTTIDNTSGTLLSAGLFTGGDKAVVNTDSLNVSYSLAF